MSESAASAEAEQPSSFRWWLLAVVFAAGVLNYVDRSILSITMIDPAFKRDMLGLASGARLTPALDGAFKERVGLVDGAFKAAYAIGFLLSAFALGRLGLRRAYAGFITLWSAASAATALVGSIGLLAAVRGLLAIGEAGQFPAAARTIAEWFPNQQRATAFGIMNASGNVGIILTVWLVPWMLIAHGWRASFVLVGALGSLVVVAWLMTYRPAAQRGRHTAIGRGLASETPRTRAPLLPPS